MPPPTVPPALIHIANDYAREYGLTKLKIVPPDSKIMPPDSPAGIRRKLDRAYWSAARHTYRKYTGGLMAAYESFRKQESTE